MNKRLNHLMTIGFKTVYEFGIELRESIYNLGYSTNPYLWLTRFYDTMRLKLNAYHDR